MEAVVAEITTKHGSSQLEKIGQGFCGTVWAAPCTSCVDSDAVPQHGHMVMKRADGGPGRSLPNEFRIHKLLMETPAPKHTKFRVNIPKSLGYLKAEDQTWSSILPRLPASFSSCDALLSERIPPLQLSTRKLLALKFFPNVKLDMILASASDKHCLIRPYLGRRMHRRDETAVGSSRPRLQAFSLRNFPLHVDQMAELGIDVYEYAIAMADVLAFLH